MGDANFWSTILIFAIPLGAMYLLFVRPQAKKARAQQNTLSSLQPGARVMTTAGIFGTVVHLGKTQAVIEIAPGVEMTLMKQAISRVTGPDEEEFEYDDYDDEQALVEDAVEDDRPQGYDQPR